MVEVFAVFKAHFFIFMSSPTHICMSKVSLSEVKANSRLSPIHLFLNDGNCKLKSH